MACTSNKMFCAVLGGRVSISSAGRWEISDYCRRTVDGILAVGGKVWCGQFGRDLNEMVPVKNLGQLRFFSGCLYERYWEKGTIKISQPSFAIQLVKGYGRMREARYSTLFLSDLGEFNKNEVSDSWPLRELEGSL